MRLPSLFVLAVLSCGTLARADDASDKSPFLDMGPAPDFRLVAQDGAEVDLALLRGKVVLVTFIYTSCPDICPLLMNKIALIQDELGTAFGEDAVIVSITLNPERDTPKDLRAYAQAFDANPAGWFFLTGEVDAVNQVASRYGMVTIPGVDSTIDHNLLTTLIDRRGRMRVQYSGYRFDPEKLRRDMLTLMAEP